MNKEDKRISMKNANEDDKDKDKEDEKDVKVLVFQQGQTRRINET